MQREVPREALGASWHQPLQVGFSSEMVALTRIRSTLLKSIREFFEADGWLEIAPIPVISTLSGACEDFSTLFKLEYSPGVPGYLIQTGQQHLEPLIRGPISKVFAVNQSCRAERKDANRRLTVFTIIEAEAARVDLAGIQSVQERLIRKVCHDVALKRAKDLVTLGSNPQRLANLPFPFERITYREALKRLDPRGNSPVFGADLKPEDEIRLGKDMHGPFFVSRYPRTIKFFNMKDDSTDPELVLSSDLLVPGYGEVVGASEREDDYDRLAAKLDLFAREPKRVDDMRNLGIKGPEQLIESFRWYLDLRKDHGVPHAGFGIGFERLVQWVCDLHSIMQATEYPRSMNVLGPP